MHNKDRNILEALKRTRGLAKIYKHSDNASVYRVSYSKNLINHKEKYPLLTKKLDYLLFKQSVHLIENKLHLTMEGLLKLVGIKGSLN